MTDIKVIDLIPRRFDTHLSALQDAYKISSTPKKGLGVFATRDIPAGAIIMVEHLLIVYPVVMNVESKGELFATLFGRIQPAGVRERALSLWDCKSTDECRKEKGIVHTNGFKIELATPKAGNALGPEHSGTFLELSRVNHR